jgi:hypothetical protein
MSRDSIRQYIPPPRCIFTLETLKKFAVFQYDPIQMVAAIRLAAAGTRFVAMVSR